MEQTEKALNVFLSRTKKVCFIPFIIFSVIMGMVVHESYHWLDYKTHGMKPEEICFFGYHPDANAVGWVSYRDEQKTAFKSNETIANSLTFSVFVVTLLVLIFSLTMRVKV